MTLLRARILVWWLKVRYPEVWLIESGGVLCAKPLSWWQRLLAKR